MSKPRLLFAGTPEFALAALVALVESGQAPIAVLTQPDRPAGRGKRTTASPVKTVAKRHGIPVLHPPTLRDPKIVADLRALQADVMVVAAYGLLLPQIILDIPSQGCVNVHASLLPRWRGASPVQAAILAGDAKTGVSLMKMTAGLDSGPVYCDASVAIEDEETAGELHDRLAALGGQLIAEKLNDILAGEIEPVAQNEEAVTYAAKITTQDAELDWQLTADELQRRVCAYNPVPGAYFFVGDLRVKCWQASTETDINAAPGTVVECGADRVVIACRQGGLRLESLQLPGKRRISAQEFAAKFELRGTRLSA